MSEVFYKYQVKDKEFFIKVSELEAIDIPVEATKKLDTVIMTTGKCIYTKEELPEDAIIKEATI